MIVMMMMMTLLFILRMLLLMMIFYAAECTSVFKTLSYEKFKQCRPPKVTAGCKGRYIHVLLVITSHLNFPTLVYTTSAPSTVCECGATKPFNIY